jgi:hypothetical protein
MENQQLTDATYNDLLNELNILKAERQMETNVFIRNKITKRISTIITILEDEYKMLYNVN